LLHGSIIAGFNLQLDNVVRFISSIKSRGSSNPFFILNATICASIPSLLCWKEEIEII
jgi:hypothetical protein